MRVVDSHTGGEPTRIVVDGLPDLAGNTIVERRDAMRSDHDWVRTALIDEPRGSDVVVGAALVPAASPDCHAGVLFFNNVGYLPMCGHGLIGVVTTLAYLGEIEPGTHRFETPAGVVTTTLAADGRVTFQNVPSYRYRADVGLDIPGEGCIRGDIAWGGNWFFLVSDHDRPIDANRIHHLTEFTSLIRATLEASGITGRAGEPIDHIELIANEGSGRHHYKNFVLCPGMAYDRSPCGTGSSAKVACLAEDGQLLESEMIRIRGIAGETFEATYQRRGSEIVPSVTGRAFVTAESKIVFDPEDPFRYGFGPRTPLQRAVETVG